MYRAIKTWSAVHSEDRIASACAAKQRLRRASWSTTRCSQLCSGVQHVKHGFSRSPGSRLVQLARPERSTSDAELVLTEPVSLIDVDRDLWEVLDLCTDSELESIYDVLHDSSPFSPIVKTLIREKEPALVSVRGRASVMHKIEQRFRFLAADATAVLKGVRPSYRATLLSIRERLNIQCPLGLSTPDLETEVFVKVLQDCTEYMQEDPGQAPGKEASGAHVVVDKDDVSGRSSSGRSSWLTQLVAPVRAGLMDLLPSAVTLGGVVTVTTVGRRAAERLGSELVCQHLRYKATLQAATGAARVSVAGWQRQAALSVAQKGVVAATARYSAIRTLMAFVGPLMWGWFAVDLALKSVGTDYARIIRTVYLLAQVRLMRTGGFVNIPADDEERLTG